MWDCKYQPQGGDLQTLMARISWFSAGEASSGPKFRSTCEIAESRNVHPSIWLVSAMVTDMWHNMTIERFRAGQITNWKNGANQFVKSNPRLRTEAGWYVADHIRIQIEPPHAFDCRKRAKRNRIRNLKNLAVRNSENTCRLSGSSIRNRIRNLQSAEPLYYFMPTTQWQFHVTVLIAPLRVSQVVHWKRESCEICVQLGKHEIAICVVLPRKHWTPFWLGDTPFVHFFFFHS